MPKFLYDLPILKTDAYKIGHAYLYPKNTTKIYSTLIPRENSYFKYSDKMVVFGYQMFAQKILIDDFNKNFFDQPLEDVLYTYNAVIASVLGENHAHTDYIQALHELGYLPVKIMTLPEGTLVPMKVPVLTIENTHPDFPWITNFLETILLSETFVTTTVATTAFEFRKIAEKWGNATADDLGYLDYQFHDFSERGQHGNDASILSGTAHLLSFKGSDVLQAPMALQRYYRADLEDMGSVSASVLATEHSVMEALSASLPEDLTNPDEHQQVKVYAELIKQNPTGILSVVSDTYDYWAVINEVLPELKDEIMARDGKLVLRPDSGSMLDNIKGALESLWSTFGGTVNNKGYKVLDSHVGLIYGEGITIESADEVFKMMADLGFSAENIVLGVGAYVYSVQTTRDTFAQAIKAQVAEFDVEGATVEKLIFKDPKGDTEHLKRSLKGAVVDVFDNDDKLIAIDGLTLEEANNYSGNQLRLTFEDGELFNVDNLSTIRQRLLANLPTGSEEI